MQLLSRIRSMISVLPIPKEEPSRSPNRVSRNTRESRHAWCTKKSGSPMLVHENHAQQTISSWGPPGIHEINPTTGGTINPSEMAWPAGSPVPKDKGSKESRGPYVPPLHLDAHLGSTGPGSERFGYDSVNLTSSHLMFWEDVMGTP